MIEKVKSVKEDENEAYLTNNQRKCAGENGELAIICVVLAKVDHRMIIHKIAEIFTTML